MAVVPQTLQEDVTADGTIPFREWLAALRDVRARARVRVRLNHLRLGNFGDVRRIFPLRDLDKASILQEGGGLRWHIRRHVIRDIYIDINRE